jgi:LytS/YehU family sensor histidine kinase
MDKELEDARRRISELEQQLDESQREVRLMKLRRQVTPHFLYNGISVAVSLVMQSPGTAIKFLRHFAQIYRYLQSYGDEYQVPVEQELELMRQYYNLMCLRHVDCIILNISPEVKLLKSYPLPPLSLLGLMENAIKHNVHTEEEPLSVSLDTDGRYLSISNKIAPLVSDTDSTHLGLAYIDETMRQLFNRGIEIINDGNMFKVMIPLIDMRQV